MTVANVTMFDAQIAAERIASKPVFQPREPLWDRIRAGVARARQIELRNRIAVFTEASDRETLERIQHSSSRRSDSARDQAFITYHLGVGGAPIIVKNRRSR